MQDIGHPYSTHKTKKWFDNEDIIKEQLGLLPPDKICLIEDWQPTAPDDMDPRQFCNINLRRNKGTPVYLDHKNSN